MQEIIIELQPHFINIVLTVLTALAALIGKQVKQYLNTKEKRDIVDATVRYVEQVGKNLGSEEKLELAKVKALEWINSRGFNVSEVELEILIEATVQSFYRHAKED